MNMQEKTHRLLRLRDRLIESERLMERNRLL